MSALVCKKDFRERVVHLAGHIGGHGDRLVRLVRLSFGVSSRSAVIASSGTFRFNDIGLQQAKQAKF